MRILITGADTALGRLASDTLRSQHEVKLTGADPLSPPGCEELEYTPADLREPSQAARLVANVDAVAHLAPYTLLETPDAAAERFALDTAARGTFVLLHAARAGGVRRFVLASRLELMAAYDESCVVDENWIPQPEPSARGLAPYVAELTLREFVRAEEMVGVCLRLGQLGDGRDGTTRLDAAAAISRALSFDLEGRKYRWWLFHVGSTARYPLAAAAAPPFSFSHAAGG